MESLADYRAKHALEYQKRIQEEKAQEQRIAEELAEKLAEETRIREFNAAFITNIESCAIKLLVCHNSTQMLEILLDLDNNIDVHIHKFTSVNTDDQSMMKKIVDAVLKVFESVNNNTDTKINFNDREQINTSKAIQQTMKALLGKVGIQHTDDNLEVNYEMDCTQDEEFAQQLYLEEQQRVNARFPHIPPAPAPVPTPNRRQRRAAAIVIPRVHVDPSTDGIPPTPRGRGRPRRNPIPQQQPQQQTQPQQQN